MSKKAEIKIKPVFDEDGIVNLRSEIDALCKDFMEASIKPTNKAGAMRARKISLIMEKALKQYRKISIKKV